MRRTPEPELMTDLEQVEAYAAADFDASDAAFVADFVARFGDSLAERPGPILDLGCGPGNITFRLARALPGREIIGVDGSTAMIAKARDRQRRTEDGERIRFVEARLPSEALGRGAYAAVVSNSLLHHLPDPDVLWSSIAQAAAPGAPVFVGDLRRPPSPEAARALMERYTADEAALLREDFLASLHAAFEADEVRRQIEVAGLDLRVYERGDRYLTIAGTR